jgi:hypothetical protein
MEAGVSIKTGFDCGMRKFSRMALCTLLRSWQEINKQKMPLAKSLD